jgi:hypothetical protein
MNSNAPYRLPDPALADAAQELARKEARDVAAAARAMRRPSGDWRPVARAFAYVFLAGLAAAITLVVINYALMARNPAGPFSGLGAPQFIGVASIAFGLIAMVVTLLRANVPRS